MRTRSSRLRWLVVPALTVGLIAFGAGAATASAPAKKLKSATLNGSGSTLQQAYDQAAIAKFLSSQSNLSINYAGGGSGKGRQDLSDQVVDFAGSDSPFPAADLAKVKGGAILYFPTVVAPVTLSYNLSGVKNLQLSGKTISKIFQGLVTKWNDPVIKADNPKAKLPSTSITLAVRSDSSGTTANFTTFLTKADPTGWKPGAGSTINWPKPPQSGMGNSGVASIVSSTDGAIGYVDFSDAKAAGLKFASVKNQLGKFVKPSVKAASEAAATVAIGADLTYDPIYATGVTSYPITAPTWIIVYKAQTDAAKRAALKAFLTYILTKGQKLAPTVNYAPLPSGLAKKALAQLTQITG